MASKIPINQLPPGSFLTGSEQVAVVQNNTTVQVPTSYFFPGTNTAFSRYAFIATAGQTNFGLPYTPGLLSVYQNGLLLSTSRYTATNSTAVVLNTAASAGDDIEVFTFLNAANVGNMYTDFSNATGINAVNHGGTGTSTSTGTGSVVLSNAPTLVGPNLGTVASGVLTGATGLPLSTGVTGTLTVSNGGTGANTLTGYLYGNGTGAVTASTTISGANITGNISGNAANVTGTVAVLNGGTGVTTSTGSGSVVLNTAPTLAGPNITSGIVLKGATSQTVTLQTQSVAGNYTLTLPSTAGSLNYALITDGSGNLSWSPGGGTVSSVNVSGGTTGLTTSGGPIVGSGTITLAGTLNVANGGTGVTSSTGTGNVVLSNAPTFTAPNLGTPNSGTLTNCSGLTLTGGAGVTGILPVPNGGTGLSTAPTNGQLLIGSTGVGYALATLTAGTNISSITNGAGSITINATGSVSSVNVSGGTTGLSFTGGPVTSSGTITAGGTLTPANGGTGANSLTGYVYGNGTGVMTASTTVPVTSIGSLGTGVASALQNNIGSTGAPVTFNGALGTPSSGTLTNASGLPLTTGVTGTLPIGNGGTGSTSATGTGSVVLQTSPSLTTPSLGVATATSINGLTVSNTTGTLTLANGSTLTTVGGFSTTLTATGATALTLPTSGTLATTANTVASFSAGTTGLTPNTTSTGAVILGGTLAIANGGTNATTATGAQSTLQYKSAATNSTARTYLSKFSDIISVLDFGATGNTISLSGSVSISSGTAALTVSTATFTSADVGKTIYVPGAGTAGATLVTTISAYTSATQVTLAANASTTLSAVTETIIYGTDDTTAVGYAITAVQGTNTTLLFPAGIYLISTVLITGSIMLVGEGLGTQILAKDATSHVFDVNNVPNDPGCVVESMYFNASITRTAGAFIRSVSAQGQKIRNCRFDNSYWAIYVTGSTATQGLRILNCQINSSLNIGIVINQQATGPQGLIDGIIDGVLIFGPSAVSQTPVGVQISSVGDLQLRHISTVWCNNGLAILPPTGSLIQSLVVTDSYFDSGSANGIYLVPSGGSIQLVKIANTWCATNAANGIYIGGTGLVQQVDMVNCTVANNSNNGVYIASTIATNVSFVGGSLSANVGSGFVVAANINNFKVVGAVIGASGQFGGNGYGVYVSGGSSNNYVITANTFTTNTTSNFFDAGTGTAKYTAGNTGATGVQSNLRVNVQPATDWAVDFTPEGTQAIAAAGNLVLATGSGMVMVHNNGTGALGLFLLYAGNVVKVSGDGTIVSGVPGASQIGVQWTGSVYEITNGYASTQNVYVSLLKTRPSN